MYLGKALRVKVVGLDKQEVIETAKKYCTENGYYIWVNIYSRFNFMKWKREYRMELYKPIGWKIEHIAEQI